MAVDAQGQALEATEIAARAVAESTLVREVIGSVADTSTTFHRRTEDLEVRLDVAVALNDELSLAVDSVRSDVQTSRRAVEASQSHLEELERIKRSLVASTEELSRPRSRWPRSSPTSAANSSVNGRLPSGWTSSTGIYLSTPFTTRADGLRVEDTPGRPVMGFRAGWHSPPMFAGFEQTFVATKR